MENLMFKSWVKVQLFKQSVKNKAHDAKEYLLTEKGGADTIIIAVIIILVVVVLGFIFKDWIIEWFSGAVKETDEQFKNNSNIGDKVPKPGGGT